MKVLQQFFIQIFMVSVLLTLNIVTAAQDTLPEWKLLKDDNGIKVYTKKLPDLRIKKVKVESDAITSLSQIINLIKHAENHNNWVFMSDNARIVEEIGDFNWKYYNYSETPWPVSDRDYYTSVTLTQNKNDSAVTITSVSIPDYRPELNNCVRIPYIHSIWRLSPIQSGCIHIIFEIEVDPGGSLPAWLVNFAVGKGPYYTMSGLLDEIKNGKYKNCKLSYIAE